MSTGKKIALGGAVFLVVLLVALAIAVPMLVDVDRYRPQVVAFIQEQTGKPAEIGRLTLTLFPTLSRPRGYMWKWMPGRCGTVR